MRNGSWRATLLLTTMLSIPALSGTLESSGESAKRPGSVEANAPGNLDITLEIEEGAAYLKHDLNLKFTFVNRVEPAVTIESEAFAVAAFTLTDAKGRSAGTPTVVKPPAVPETAEPLVVNGFAAAERRVNLSAWYPKLTAKETTWEIVWSHATLALPAMSVRIIKPHDPVKDRFALVETDLGTMKWELMPELAPRHVRRFVDLARQGHYDGLTFFRYVPGVQADGGAVAADAAGIWDRLMPPEITPEFGPSRGMIGASRPQGSTSSSMTSDSMFFVTLGDSEFMQGSHTFFGRIAEGFEVMARMNQVENRGSTGDVRAYLLVKPVTIRSIAIKRR